MRIALLLVSSLAFATAGVAEDTKPRLTVEQVISVYNGLTALDGYDGICKEGSIERQCKKLYALSGSVRVTIALNLAEARRVAMAFNVANNSLVAQLIEASEAKRVALGLPAPVGGTGTKVPDDQQIKYQTELRAMQDKAADVSLATLKREDLKLDENPIPASVISLIASILDK